MPFNPQSDDFQDASAASDNTTRIPNDSTVDSRNIDESNGASLSDESETPGAGSQDYETSDDERQTDGSGDLPEENDENGGENGENGDENDDENDELTEEQEQEALLSQKTLAWALWRIFIIPRQSERSDSSDSDESNGESDGDSNEESNNESKTQMGDISIPETPELRRIGLMDYIRHENGFLGFDELLCTDRILDYQKTLSPSTPGVERYDDWGISHWEESASRFAARFFRLQPAERRKEWEEYQQIVALSPEVSVKMQLLERLLSLPADPTSIKPAAKSTDTSEAQSDSSTDGEPNRQTADSAPQSEDSDETPVERAYPPHVKGCENVFDALSGSKTFSNRIRALETLDLLLDDDFAENPERLQKQTQTLLQTYPALERCNPYLFHLIRLGREGLSVGAKTSEDYSTISTHATPFFFPVWLENAPSPSKSRAALQGWQNAYYWLAALLTLVWAVVAWGYYLFLNFLFNVF